MSTSLGMRLSITLKAGRGKPGLLWGIVAQWSGHLRLKQEGLDSIPADVLSLLVGFPMFMG